MRSQVSNFITYNTMSYSNFRVVGILMALITAPLFYVAILKLILIGLFDSPAAFNMFVFYNLPLWILLMLLTGMECYRNRVVPRLSQFASFSRLLGGSVVIGILGIVICPTGPALFSSGALSLLVTNFLLGTAVALTLLMFSCSAKQSTG